METVYTTVSVRVDKRKRQQIKDLGYTLPEVMDKAFNDILISRSTGANSLKIQKQDLIDQIAAEEQHQAIKVADYDAIIMDLKDRLENLENKKDEYLEKSNALIMDLNNRLEIVSNNLNQVQELNQEQDDYNKLFELCNKLPANWLDNTDFNNALDNYCNTYGHDRVETYNSLVDKYNNQFL